METGSKFKVVLSNFRWLFITFHYWVTRGRKTVFSCHHTEVFLKGLLLPASPWESQLLLCAPPSLPSDTIPPQPLPGGIHISSIQLQHGQVWCSKCCKQALLPLRSPQTQNNPFERGWRALEGWNVVFAPCSSAAATLWEDKVKSTEGIGVGWECRGELRVWRGGSPVPAQEGCQQPLPSAVGCTKNWP